MKNAPNEVETETNLDTLCPICEIGTLDELDPNHTICDYCGVEIAWEICTFRDKPAWCYVVMEPKWY